MVINKSSLPLFSYDRNAKKTELVSDDEILLSSFFSAIINFASQLKADELKYIVFNNRSFVLKKSADFTVIFSTYAKFSDAEITKLEESIENTSNYLLNLLREEGLLVESPILRESTLRSMISKFAHYLLDNGIIIDAEYEFDPLYVQRKHRKLIFKAIGYEPGKCNIGPQERLKRFIIGLYGLIATILVMGLMLYLNVPQLYRLLLFFPLSWAFVGFYQYFFKFCVFNGLTRKTVMK